MNKFTLKVLNFRKFNHVVLFDGNYAKPDKSDKNAYSIITPNNSVNVQIFSVRYLQSKLWFLLSPLLFLISLFGIFNLGKKDKLHSVEFEADFFFNGEDSVTVDLENPTDSAPVEISPGENQAQVDTSDKKAEIVIEKEVTTTLTAHDFNDNETAFLMNTNAGDCQIRTNRFYIDTKLKKRRKGARLINLGVTLLAIVALVLIIVL